MAAPPDAKQLVRFGGLFPLLTRFAVRGPAARYNCIAWAVGITTEIWWPDRMSYWPIRSFSTTVEAFAAAFNQVGFQPCADSRFGPSLDKIALYTLNGRPTHAARIESDAIWTSKIGMLELIEHEPEALNGQEYGLPTHFFQRLAGT